MMNDNGLSRGLNELTSILDFLWFIPIVLFFVILYFSSKKDKK